MNFIICYLLKFEILFSAFLLSIILIDFIVSIFISFETVLLIPSLYFIFVSDSLTKLVFFALTLQMELYIWFFVALILNNYCKWNTYGIIHFVLFFYEIIDDVHLSWVLFLIAINKLKNFKDMIFEIWWNKTNFSSK